MKSIFLVIFASLMIGSGSADTRPDTLRAANKFAGVPQKITFKPGEKLTYRVHYGFITAGEAVMEVNKKKQTVNGNECIQIDIFGSTAGFFDYVMRIRDNWGTYFNPKTMMPERFYMNIEEGRYRKYEVVDFLRHEDSVFVTNFDKVTKEPNRFTKYWIPDHSFDMVSGSYILRTFDYSKLKPGDIINLEGFFDKELYNMNIVYEGKELIKTDLGKIMAIKLTPEMPNNALFDGKNSISMWLSDDEYKIPVKIRAKMFVGAVEIALKSYDVPSSYKLNF
jgi:hypothetical protein